MIEASVFLIFLAMGIPIAFVLGLVALGHTVQKGQYSFFQILSASKHALVSFSVPIIIIGGIVSGIFTPSESACISAVVALVIAGLGYRKLNFRILSEILLQTGVRTAVILMVVATANLFGWILAANNIPQMLGEMISFLYTDKYILLLMINLFLLFVGMFMDSIASIIILTPILMPIIKAAGIDPIHFGVIFVLNVVIGLNTPPVGICLYVTSSVGKISIERLIRAVLPFLLSMIAVLFLVTYIPSLSLWIPKSIFR